MRIVVVDNSPGSGISGHGRREKILTWLARMDQAERDALALVLRAGERQAGDWLEARGCPRTWRKNLRLQGHGPVEPVSAPTAATRAAPRRAGQPVAAHVPAPPLVVAMPVVPPGCVAWLAVVVSNRAGNSTGGQSLLWLDRRYLSSHDAAMAGKAFVRDGLATLAFVVHVVADGSREVIPGATYPNSARDVIGHYEELWGLIEPPEEA